MGCAAESRGSGGPERKLRGGRRAARPGRLSLRRVEVDMGVGEIQMDLRGQPKQSYSVQIRGGVGEATVRLPSDVGVYAEAKGGIGEISAHGLHQDGSTYYNDAYRKSPVTIRLDIQGGVGSIKLISD